MDVKVLFSHAFTILLIANELIYDYGWYIISFCCLTE